MAADSLPVVIVEVKVVRQWGNPQQRAIDSLLYWSTAAEAEDVLKVEDQVHKILSGLDFGTFRPLGQGAENALDQLGRNRQLPLPEL